MIFASIKFPGSEKVFKNSIRVPPMPLEAPRLLPYDSSPPIRPDDPTPAQVKAYKEAVDAYEVKRNHDKRNWDEYCQRMNHWRHLSEQNSKAVSILHRVFNREDLERVSNVENAVDKVEALRQFYRGKGASQGSMASSWIREWTQLTLSSVDGPSITEFFRKYVSLVRNHMKIYPSEEGKKILLGFMVDKFETNCPKDPAFLGLQTEISSKNDAVFLPVPTPNPIPLDYYENGVKAFIDRIETCVNKFKSSLQGSSGTSSTHSANKATTSASSKGKGKGKGKDQSKGTKWCDFHKQHGSHDTESCRKRAASLSEGSSNTQGVKKNKMKGKANACGLCGNVHSWDSCPKLASIGWDKIREAANKHYEKQNQPSANLATITKVPSSVTNIPIAATAMDVDMPESSVVEMDFSRFHSGGNEQLVERLARGIAFHVKVDRLGTIIDSGASTWMTPDQPNLNYKLSSVEDS
ncbi:hypothetical protein HDU97_009654, partial [Phlyctochytrium planicorne]